jgi:hypothetical protein
MPHSRETTSYFYARGYSRGIMKVRKAVLLDIEGRRNI